MTIKLVFCLRRKPELTRAEFQRYWLDEHATLVKRLATATGMTRYIQCHTYHNRLSSAFATLRGTAEDYDGVMEGWWDSEEQAIAAIKSGGRDAGTLLLEDEARFIDLPRSSIFFVREHEIF
jgi:hypothetical protein